MTFPWYSFVAVLVALVAVGYRFYLIYPLSRTGPVIYVVGDLHGDVECAKFWVEGVGVVDSVDNPQQWLQPEASLVFMGDYVDKGPKSYQTLRFVQSLTERFPEKVTALMGNHEMELLKDRDGRRRVGYFQMPYATVHPAEYLNFLERETDATDHLVVDLLLNASLEVYAGNHYRSVIYAPYGVGGGRHVVTELMPEDIRPLVSQRLKEYQDVYINAFRSNTTLGKWLEQRPVAHVQNGFFFCHGGISKLVASALTTLDDVNEINQAVGANTNEARFVDFLEQTQTGRVVRDLLLHRGNHRDVNACEDLKTMLGGMDGMDHLVVGHTPGKNVRIQCDETLLAVDSMLGRWIRTSGNHYCPNTERRSRNGQFVCPSVTESCQGQIVRIAGNDIQVLFPGTDA